MRVLKYVQTLKPVLSDPALRTKLKLYREAYNFGADIAASNTTSAHDAQVVCSDTLYPYLLDCEKFNLDECKRKRRSHADKLTAIQRMAKSDRERHTYTNLLRKLQEQQETIYKLESEMKSLTDPSKMDLSEMLRDEANEEIREQYEDLTDVLADRRNVEKKCRNQGRLVKMREADIKRSLEVLQKELQKRKIHRLIIKAEACELKAMLAKCEEKRTLQETNESRLKRTLKSVTKGIKLKREEFEDKKVLIEKLNARIDHLERKYPVLTKTTMC
ncbi:trichohyalin-like [Diaphorina citri]|uniref:Trichohyalin-like n=1 Tax=Diaphorina citri TaxID=121845 RepID=A0A3Q0IU54_DIACI|nr:trichohyalin-like [Diaphorina citri]